MRRNQLGVYALVLLAAVSAATAVASAPIDQAAARRDIATLKQKVSEIRTRSNARRTKPVRTTISEREVNAYLLYEFAPDLPAGVLEPQLTILGPNRLAGRAVVDLDRVRLSVNPTSRLDPLYYLTGRLPVGATGTLKAIDGTGQFQLESANVSGIPIPKFALQQIVAYYSRTAERPNGVSLDSSFALPAGIREIHVDRGQAIVVQ